MHLQSLHPSNGWHTCPSNLLDNDRLEDHDSDACEFDKLPRLKQISDLLGQEIAKCLVWVNAAVDTQDGPILAGTTLSKIQQSLHCLKRNAGLLTASLHNFSAQAYSIRQLHTELQTAHNKLNLQVEQSNKLESLLAARESHMVTEAQELSETESQLASSTQLVTNLHDQLNASHNHLTYLLRRLQVIVPDMCWESSSSHLQPPNDLVELVANLNSIHKELQESERLRILVQQKVSSAVLAARRLRGHLKQFAIRQSNFHCSKAEASSQTLQLTTMSAGVQTEAVLFGDPSKFQPKSEGATDKKREKFMPYALLRPRDVLDTFDSSNDHGQDQVAALSEALRNSLVQIERLNTYRLTQKSKLDQLQQRFAQMNSELDATVDALRHHQTSAENERHRSAAELAGLRTQLAKANALLTHQNALSYKLQTKSGDRLTGPNMCTGNMQVAAYIDSQSVNDVDAQTNRADYFPLFELEVAHNELAQLRSEMAEQKANSNRETTKLRGLLAEVTADSRALRLQVLRLQNALGGTGKTSNVCDAAESESICANCQRLQRLLDILQEKHFKQPAVQGSPSAPPHTSISESSQLECVSATIYPNALEMRIPCDSPQDRVLTGDLELQAEPSSNCSKRDVIERGKERSSVLIPDHDVNSLHSAKLPSGDSRASLENNGPAFRETRICVTGLNRFVDHTGIPEGAAPNEFKSGSNQENESLVPFIANNTTTLDQLGTMRNSMFDGSVANNGPTNLPAHQPVRLSDSATSPSSEFAYIGEEASNSVLSELDMHSALQQRSTEELASEVILLRSILHEERKELERLKQLCSHNNSTTSGGNIHDDSLAVRALGWSASDATIPLTELAHDQLVARVRAAEFEAKEAVDQLKASNAEFLTLRERLSHAAVERAHLKSTVEGLDEQVFQLESSLYERVVQLNQYRAELSRYDSKYATTSDLPISQPSFRHPFFRMVDCSRFLKSIIHVLCLPLQYRRSGYLPILQSSWPLTSVSSRSFISSMNRRLGSTKSFLHHRLSAFTLTCMTRARLTSLRSRLLLHSQPRPFVIFAFVAYFFFIHLFVMRCYLL